VPCFNLPQIVSVISNLVIKQHHCSYPWTLIQSCLYHHCIGCHCIASYCLGTNPNIPAGRFKKSRL